MTSTMRFYYTRIITELFGGYKDVVTVDQLWKWMDTEMLDNMYWEYDYGLDNGDGTYNCPDGTISVGPCSTSVTDRNILYENKLLGLPRYPKTQKIFSSLHYPFKDSASF
jgi:hypothetical protein